MATLKPMYPVAPVMNTFMRGLLRLKGLNLRVILHLFIAAQFGKCGRVFNPGAEW
jgi:hypothetical protein